jgi:hypothetical protein
MLRRAWAENYGTGEQVAYAKCQVEDHLMRIKKLVVTAEARVQREVCGGLTPSGVREQRFSLEHPAAGNLYRDVGAFSWPEPDLNAAIARFRHDVVSAIVEVECGAVGQATVQLNATPLVEVGKSVAVVTECSSAWPFVKKNKVGRDLGSRGYTHPVCTRLGGIVHPGRVCKVAWFCTF